MHSILTRHLNIEAIRLNEAETPVRGSEIIDKKLAEQTGTFREKLFARADFLAELTGIDQIARQISSRITLACWLVCCVCAVLGFVAALNAFDSQLNASVNFYWLILVLIGFNLLSMLVWLGMVLVNYCSRSGTKTNTSSHQGWFNFLVNWLVGRTVKFADKQLLTNTLKAWTGVYRTSGLASWEFSRISHLFWLSYLCGGLLMVLLMLSVREYNFGWATTILQPDTFVDLTLVLAKLPEVIGLPVPDRDMITNSRLDSLMVDNLAEQPLNHAVIRTHWSGLLISALVLYGLVPRILLLLFCHLKTKQAMATYDPDYSQPYFLDLQRRLIPVTKTIGIIDADNNAAADVTGSLPELASAKLPAGARYITVELDPDSQWPAAAIDSAAMLTEANDSDSQYRALEVVNKLNEPLVCVVSLMRSPDRGIARFIGELKEQCSTPFYLMVYGHKAIEDSCSEENHSNRSVADLRLGDWHRLAVQLDITDSHFIYLWTLPKAALSAQGTQS